MKNDGNDLGDEFIDLSRNRAPDDSSLEQSDKGDLLCQQDRGPHDHCTGSRQYPFTAESSFSQHFGQ